MNVIGSASLGNTAFQPSTPALSRSTQQATAASATLNQVSSQQRSSFSTKELGEMMAAMAPAMRDLPSEQAAQAMSGLLNDLATRRASGQDAMLVAFEVPGGGSMATTMSASELKAALASDDPNSLGSVTTNDGKTVYFRDVMREALGMNDEAAAKAELKAKAGPSAKDKVAAAVVEMLEQASRKTDAAESSKANGAQKQGMFMQAEVDGTKVSLLALPGKAEDAKQAGSGMLVDVQI